MRFPPGWRIEPLRKEHDRKSFESGEAAVDDWLRSKARQSQDKRLSSTRVVLDEDSAIAGYYTLAIGWVALEDLPHDISRRLPNQLVPVITLAWMGRHLKYRGAGLGNKILGAALADCDVIGDTIAFVAVVLDCLTADAKAFYEGFEFRSFPQHPMKLLLPFDRMRKIVRG